MAEFSDRQTIRLRIPKNLMNQCQEFARDAAETHQRIEFGEQSTNQRSFKEVERDILIGKMAEVAFWIYAKRLYELNFELDWGIYPRGIWDKADVEVNKWLIDIKASRNKANWLLVELNKINFRKEHGESPDFFVLASTAWNMQTDNPKNLVALKGYAHISEMNKDIPKTLLLKKGNFIPNTYAKLQADNFARNASDLNDKWNMLFSKLKKENDGSYKKKMEEKEAKLNDIFVW